MRHAARHTFPFDLAELGGFLRRVALPLAIAFTVVACSRKSPCITKGVDVEVSGDHPHSAIVESGGVERGAAHTYSVQGDGHRHVFMLTADDMGKLQRGQIVHTRSTSTNAHGHEITVRCKE